MNLNELPLEHQLLADRNVAIKLIGVGGAGSNAVDRLKMESLDRLQLAVINTDHQALSSSPVQDKILIGLSVTRGLGAGGDPELGREAAEADREKIANVVKDCDLVFLLAGMGGGTGGGAAPIVAEIAAEAGARWSSALSRCPSASKAAAGSSRPTRPCGRSGRPAMRSLRCPMTCCSRKGSDNETVPGFICPGGRLGWAAG